MIDPQQLRKGIPITDDPYEDLALQYSMDKDELLECLNKMVEKGEIIKFRALLDHRKLGYKVNALIAMRIENFDASKIPGLENISHFYIREPNEKFPYDYYAMSHFKNDQDLMEFSKALESLGIKHEILKTLKNLKRGSK